jgi:hypothetical protein
MPGFEAARKLDWRLAVVLKMQKVPNYRNHCHDYARTPPASRQGPLEAT